MNRLRKEDWYVANVDLKLGQAMVRRLHYARGGSNTAVHIHGLFRRIDDQLMGISWWLPPTRVAAESVDRENWQGVLSLTRLVIEPDVPRNACTFLLARSRKLVAKDTRWVALVTYADESQGHTGAIYRADNWTYIGRTGPYPRWLDSTGKQVAPKATKNRTKAQMEALGHCKVGSFYKHKFVKIISR